MLLSAALLRPAARPTRPARCPVSNLPPRPSTGRSIAVIVAAAKTEYKSPSTAPGATELDILSADTRVVPDVMLLGSALGSPDVLEPQAATVSAGVLAGLIAGTAGSGAREYQIAIERAVQQHRGDKDAALDAAIVSVGALFAKKVAGRVSTEVDPRAADDADALVAKGKALAAAYKDLGVSPDKFLLRIPATWAGIQAAGQLEAAGLRTHVTNVASLVQAVAAAQAGVAVIQPSVAALADWYRAFPNAIKNPKGPREDAGGAGDGASPGVNLVTRIWCYMRRFHPGTAVMASGVRTREEALALSGVDFLVTGPKVLASLAAKPTTAGYNDGLRSTGGGSAPGPALTQALADATEFDAADTAQVTKQLFEEGLGAAGRDLLTAGVARLKADVDRVVPAMQSLTVGGV